METFKMLRSVLIQQGIIVGNSNIREMNAAIGLRCFFLSSAIILCLSTSYFALFTAQSIQEQNESRIYALAFLMILLWYSICLWKKNYISKIFNDLNEIVNERIKGSIAKIIYEKNEGIIQYMTNMARTIVIRIVVPIFFSIPIILSVRNCIFSDFSNESFQQFYPATYSFDWKSPFGYFWCCVIQVQQLWIGAHIYTTSMCLIIGLCIYPTAFISDLETKIKEINIISAINGKKINVSELSKFSRIFGEFIQFYAVARQFTNRSSKITSEMIFVYFMYITCVFRALCVHLHSTSNNGDSSETLRFLMLIACSLFPLFIFCYFGGRVTQRFENIGDQLYQINWYNLPPKMQKQVSMVIAISQKKVYVRGFNDARSTKEVFIKMVKYKFYCILLLWCL